MADDSTALTHAVAGCIGATAALGLFYPLDLIRTLRQAQAAKKMQGASPQGSSSGSAEPGGGAAAKEPIPSLQIRSPSDLAKLYHGFLSSVSTQGISFFVYFFAFRFFQRRFPVSEASSAAGNLE